MFSLALITVGTLKEGHWQSAQSEYLMRLRPFARVLVKETEAESLTPSISLIHALAKEGDRLRKALPKGAFVIALDPRGKMMASERLAAFLDEHGGTGGTLAFVIGGAAGLDPVLRKDADAVLSLSSLTFSHELARIVLLEQLYRAMTILAGKKYHY